MVNEMQQQDATSIDAQTLIWKSMLSFADAMTLRCAVELHIPDIIHEHAKDQPISLSKLANILKIQNSDTLLRIMRFLSHNLIFSTTLISDEPHYSLTPASHALLTSSTNNLVPMLLFQTHPLPVSSWHMFSSGILAGTNPYALKHGVESVFMQGKTNSEFNNVFNSAMACVNKGLLDVVMDSYKDGFKGFKSVVDVGGGTGEAMAEIVRLNPGVKGINFDLPFVVETAKEHPGVEHVGGDMFEFIPQAQAIFMKTVMHCFGDEECTRVLKNCHRVIPESGKVIIVDVVLYAKDDSPMADIRAKFDMIVYAYTSTGKERTEEEWKKLLNAAGFPRLNFIQIPAIWSIIEAFPL